MCRPTYFDVSYEINPWMDASDPVDTARAVAQWDRLRETYERLGHEVLLVDPVDGLPDLVFAANGGLVVRGRAVAPRFAHPERQGETPVWRDWLAAHVDPDVVVPEHPMEGEGDARVVRAAGGPGTDPVLLVAEGMRTVAAAHDGLAAVTGLEVVPLTLVDARYYHLDTALAVLAPGTVAVHPPALAHASLDLLRERVTAVLEVDAADAAVLGLNAVSDGRHVVLPEQAHGFARTLRTHGFEPVGVDLSELLRSGGGPKCCTLLLDHGLDDWGSPTRHDPS